MDTECSAVPRSFELGPPTPSPAGECIPPQLGWGGGGAHSLAGEGVGGPNSDEGTDEAAHDFYI